MPADGPVEVPQAGAAKSKEEPKKDAKPKLRPVPCRLLVVAVFCLALTITTLDATYICTWLGEYEYNVQIAKDVVILFWLFMMAWTFNFQMTFDSQWMFPKDDTTTYSLIGFVCIATMIMFFSTTLLSLLYKGNIGVAYITVQGTRELPKLDPRMLYNASIGIYSTIGGIGLIFLGLAGYSWIG